MKKISMKRSCKRKMDLFTSGMRNDGLIVKINERKKRLDPIEMLKKVEKEKEDDRFLN